MFVGKLFLAYDGKIVRLFLNYFVKRVQSKFI